MFSTLTVFLIQDELKNELAELEQEELNKRLAGAERAPSTSLPSMGYEERAYSYYNIDVRFIHSSTSGPPNGGGRRRGGTTKSFTSRVGGIAFGRDYSTFLDPLCPIASLRYLSSLFKPLFSTQHFPFLSCLHNIQQGRDE